MRIGRTPLDLLRAQDEILGTDGTSLHIQVGRFHTACFGNGVGVESIAEEVVVRLVQAEPASLNDTITDSSVMQRAHIEGVDGFALFGRVQPEQIDLVRAFPLNGHGGSGEERRRCG